jgi:chromosomal replication initiator protein
MPDSLPNRRTTTPTRDAATTWQSALSLLREKTSKAHFETYLSKTQGEHYDAGASVLRVRSGNPFHVPWLENKFSNAVHSAIAEVLGEPVRVEFVTENAAEAEPVKAPPPSPLEELLDSLPEPEPQPEPVAPARPASRPAPVAREADLRGLQGSPLNPRYTFDTFIVGSSNQLAYAASEAAAEEPGRAYNPLFIYGGVGLGKTHLLHAIGHGILAKGLNVVYVTSETFTNEMIESIRQHRMDDFRSKYRRANLLMVDDVQFIAGKERTEEEFFHTFNAIHDAGGQIVLTSDRLPRSMPILEDRLRSRFEWGLIADVQLPDFETRVAILRSKLRGPVGSQVKSEVIDFIAQKVQSNIRELEGSLNRLLAHAHHLGQLPTIDLASTVLRDLASPTAEANRASPDTVLQAVVRYFGVTLDDLRGKARHKEIVMPRQVAMYVLREDTRLSTPEIGKLLNRDHTTVLHGVNLVANEVARNGPARAALRGVREVLAAAASESRAA